MSISREEIAKLYLATFGRPLDSGGLDYWTNSGIYEGIGSTFTTMEELSECFSDQVEYQNMYPAGTTDSSFIISIYTNLLQREPDAGGLNYWVNELEKGIISRANMILAIINGAQDTQEGSDATLLENRTNFSLELAANGISAEDATSQEYIDIVMSVTDDVSTIPVAEAMVDVLVANDAYDAAAQAVAEAGSNVTAQQLETLEATLEAKTAAEFTLTTISDTIAPDAPTIDTVSIDNIINAAEELIGFNLSGTGEVRAIVTLTGALLASGNTTIVDEFGNWTMSISTGELNEGVNLLSITQTDLAGNISIAETTTITVDTTASTLELSNINLGLGELSTVNTYGVEEILSSSYWDFGLDRVITYSFNASLPSDYYNYGDGTELTTNWTALNSNQQDTINSIFNQLGNFLDITFTEVADTSAQIDGMIQLNIVDMDSNTSGFAFYPGDYYSYSGDIFLSSAFNSDPSSYGLLPSEQGWATMVHELGHALGLEHSFDAYPFLPTAEDDINHTVMSYTNTNVIFEFDYISYPNVSSSISSTSRYLEAELYSLYDVAALQAIYGVNSNTSTENNTYIFNYTDYAINTIWDAGGEDTIDLSSTVGSNIIDLNSGSLNSADLYTIDNIIALHQNLVDDNGDFDSWISDVINDTNNGIGVYTGENNFAIATGTIIENIATGSGNDIITDNEVDNIIATYLGNDSIYLGYGGYDYVDGGDGFDTIYIDIAQNDALISEILEDGSYSLTYTNFGVNFVGIEAISFNDGTWFV